MGRAWHDGKLTKCHLDTKGAYVIYWGGGAGSLEGRAIEFFFGPGGGLMKNNWPGGGPSIKKMAWREDLRQIFVKIYYTIQISRNSFQ